MNKKNFLICVILLIIFPFPIKANSKIDVTLNKCVDGDTAWFNIGSETIKARFLAINTPESTNKIEEYGKEASKYTCDLLTNAKNIQIEYDEASDQKDKYDRDLVWVFVDGKLLQELIVKNGYAEIKYVYNDNYKYLDQLNTAEKQAKDDKLNIWSEYKQDYTDYIIVGTCFIIILLLFIFSKTARKKIISKTKSNMKKTFKNSLKNLK